MIVCEECGNRGTVELVLYTGKTFGDLRHGKMIVGRERLFRLYYESLYAECPIIPTFFDFDPSLEEHQRLLKIANERTGMGEALGMVEICNVECPMCNYRAELRTNLIPFVYPLRLLSTP